MKCNAALRNCWACGKVGHYPQSLNCKAKKRKQNKKQFSASDKVNFHQNMKISEKSLKLVKKRMKQLEQESSVELNKIANTRKAFSKPMRDEVIPFFLMYIFLNHDCLFLENKLRSQRLKSKQKDCQPILYIVQKENLL